MDTTDINFKTASLLNNTNYKQGARDLQSILSVDMGTIWVQQFWNHIKKIQNRIKIMRF